MVHVPVLCDDGSDDPVHLVHSRRYTFALVHVVE